MTTRSLIFTVRKEYREEVDEAYREWMKNGSASVKFCQAIVKLWREEQKA